MAGVRLGKQQLALLASMASPFSILIVLDPLARRLVERGLLGERPHPRREREGCYAITPAGLRALAEALDAGAVEPLFDPHFMRDRARLYLDGRRRSAA